jgi:hypothetical protein
MKPKGKHRKLLVAIGVPIVVATIASLSMRSEERIRAGMHLDEFIRIMNDHGTPLHIPLECQHVEILEASSYFLPGRTFSIELDPETRQIRDLSIRRPTAHDVISHWKITARVFLGR